MYVFSKTSVVLFEHCSVYGTVDDTEVAVSECVGFNVSPANIIGHFRDESFQATDCTGTDNQIIYNTTKRKYIKHKITSPPLKQINWL